AATGRDNAGAAFLVQRVKPPQEWRSSALLEPYENRSLADLHALGGDFRHHAVMRRGDGVLHFHGLEHEQRLPLGNALVLGDADDLHQSGHGCAQAVAAGGKLLRLLKRIMHPESMAVHTVESGEMARPGCEAG